MRIQMMRMMITTIIMAALAFLTLAPAAHAHPNYIGYSGAPGSNGRCASSCHGSTGGTVQVTGFPSQYAPGQAYTVAISHNGGSTIANFNGSCRIGAGSVNAGSITGGTNTVTYNTSGETNGIHFTSSNLESGDFVWTAPATGTGEVRLYVAGHQGSAGGANTTLVLVATEQTAAAPDGGASAAGIFQATNYPNPFNAGTAIGYVLPQSGPVLLEIFDPSGRRMVSFAAQQSAGFHQYLWNGARGASGTYFYRITAGLLSQTKKMILSK